MANASMLRELALALDTVTVAPHFDRTAFKAKRIFVTVAADGLSANFKFTPDEQALKCTVMPEAFSPVPNAWGQQGWTVGVLSKLNKTELASALEMAWRHALPARKKQKP
jgi:hypothetical protein